MERRNPNVLYCSSVAVVTVPMQFVYVFVAVHCTTTLSLQDWTTITIVSQPTMTPANKTLWAHQKPSSHTESPCLPSHYSWYSEQCLGCTFRFLCSLKPPHKNAIVNQTPLVRSICTVNVPLPDYCQALTAKPSNVEQSDREVPIATKVKKELSNSITLQRIGRNGQKGFENIVNMLRVELAKHSFFVVKDCNILCAGFLRRPSLPYLAYWFLSLGLSLPQPALSN